MRNKIFHNWCNKYNHNFKILKFKKIKSKTINICVLWRKIFIFLYKCSLLYTILFKNWNENNIIFLEFIKVLIIWQLMYWMPFKNFQWKISSQISEYKNKSKDKYRKYGILRIINTLFPKFQISSIKDKSLYWDGREENKERKLRLYLLLGI